MPGIVDYLVYIAIILLAVIGVLFVNGWIKLIAALGIAAIFICYCSHALKE